MSKITTNRYPNPFKGLAPYNEDESRFFHGREDVIEELLERLKDKNLLVLTGPSGAGKTSLVRAGLIPALQQKSFRLLPVIEPGESPFTELSEALWEFKREDTTLTGQLEAVCHALVSRKHILTADHLEELFTRCCSEDERNSFIKVLKILLDSNHNGLLKIILVLRSDFEIHFRCSELAIPFQNSLFRLTDPTAADLSQMISEPLHQTGVRLESHGLTDRIVRDIQQCQGVLPLLSFTMHQLYRQYEESGREDKILPESDYDALSKEGTPLNVLADWMYRPQPPDIRRVMRKILLRMVYLGEETLPAGKPVLIEELDFPNEKAEHINQSLSILSDAGFILIQKSQKGTGKKKGDFIRLTHEYLISGWNSYFQWLEEYRLENIILLNRLETMRRQSAGNKTWSCYKWPEFLAEQENSPESCLNRSEIHFLQKSLKNKHLRGSITWSLLMGILLLLLFLSSRS